MEGEKRPQAFTRDEARRAASWVTPRGVVAVDLDALPEPLPAGYARAVRAGFALGSGWGLLQLGGRALPQGLPADLVFWHRLGHRVVAQVCAHPEMERLRENIELPPDDGLEALCQQLPPMRGGDFVDAALLVRLRGELLAAYRAEVANFDGRPQDYLQSLSPLWHGVGRIYFHLAENKREGQPPFAFLATYTDGLGVGQRARHLPLGQALAAGASRAQLVKILDPVRRAAAASALCRRLLDDKRLFSPQAWEAHTAYLFLQDIPVFEAAGVIVRVPDWWRKRSRVQATATVDRARNAGITGDDLLAFEVGLALEGEALTARECAQLRDASGLVQVRGQWVEVDAERLQQALAQLQQLKSQHPAGLTFAQGMRLLAGLPSDDRRAQSGDEDRVWQGAQAGPDLRRALDQLRQAGPWSPPPGLEADLRPYQRVGVQWLLRLRALGVGGCLADDMGLGKTLQVLALLLATHAEDGLPSLLVLPASLVGNWEEEAARFAPSLRLERAHGHAAAATSPAVRQRQLRGRVLLATYGMLQRQAWLIATEWNLVVVDEAQAIKNPGTRQAQAVKSLRGRQRLALTGTPVENRAADLWSLFDFINPGLLGSAAAFQRVVQTLPGHQRRGIGTIGAAAARPGPHWARIAGHHPFCRQLAHDIGLCAAAPPGGPLHPAAPQDRQTRHCRSARQDRGDRLLWPAAQTGGALSGDGRWAARPAHQRCRA